MPPSTSTLPHTTSTRTDVLLIDDSITDLQLLMQMMTLQDLRISVAFDGTSGYQQAVLQKPGLILLDVCMPDIDGFTVCRRLKAIAETRDIPVIFLSAETDLNERLEGFRSGAVDYICKPFEDQEVLARVGVHLQRTELLHGHGIIEDSACGPGTGDKWNNATLVIAGQQLLRESLKKPPGIEEMARSLGTNRRRLNDAFQALCGQPVYGWLREERMRQAYLRVSQKKDAFSVIGESLGFSSPANFAKAFRIRFGYTPSEIRAQKPGHDEID